MIDYNIIGASVTHYERQGYQRVEVPWTVTEEVSAITKPPQSQEFKLIHENGKVLVASGEQGFLYQYIKGFLPKGKFQTITPCFRFENQDFFHAKTFMKNELINTLNVSYVSLTEMIGDAMSFFKHHVTSPNKLRTLVTSENSIDIVYDNVELGSYGIRQHQGFSWVYGTAVAEPRFSKVRFL